MSIEVFISVLMLSCASTSVAIELIKNLLDTAKIKYNVTPFAIGAAFIVGVLEMLIYTSMYLTFEPVTVVFCLCMGMANAIGSCTSYDLVKKFIVSLVGGQTK